MIDAEELDIEPSHINIEADTDSDIDKPQQKSPSRLPASQAFDVNGSMVSQSMTYLGHDFGQKKLEIKYTKHKKYPKQKPKYTIMDEDTYEFNLKYCKIRPNKNFNNMARVETPWSVEIGIFKDYLKEQRKSLIDKCFESDWVNMKAGSIKFKKSTEAEVK